MSALSRSSGTRTRPADATVPTQRSTPVAGRPGATAPSRQTNRGRAAAVLAAGAVVVGAASVGVWALVDDDSTPATAVTQFTTITPESRAETEAMRDAAHAGRGVVTVQAPDAVGARQRTEALRDAARANSPRS